MVVEPILRMAVSRLVVVVGNVLGIVDVFCIVQCL